MDHNSAQQIFLRFIQQLPPKARVSVLGHSDADGLTAAVILARALQAKGFAVDPDVTRKGETAWSPSALERMQQHQPAALLVADLGSRDEPLVNNLPTLLLDHHKPTGVPPGAIFVSGYEMEPVPTSGLLAFWCAQALGLAEDMGWLAAISILADLGDKTDFPEWTEGRRAYRSKDLREIATLLNAPRRAASGDATPALDLLMSAADPAAFLADERIGQLRAAKAEYDAELKQARRAGPKFSGNVALITVHSPCQVHPVVAQTWVGRLSKNIVICANTGFLPERVNFAVRTKLPVNLIDFLQTHKPESAGPEFGRGHDQATGGSLRLSDWERFLHSLGFR
jgi:single-stranded-DNA-specific exonuclease